MVRSFLRNGRKHYGTSSSRERHDHARRHGLLLNPIYAGRLIWNRVRMVRDPDTGRRVSRPNPESEWQTADVPELAIVDAETWQAAQEHKLARQLPRHPTARTERARKGILSGLIRCGKCGGGMSRHGASGGVARVKCSTHTESRTCDNGRRYRLDRIETATISAVRDKLDRPEGLVRWLDAWQADRRAEGAARARLMTKLAARKAALDRLSSQLIYERITEEFFDREAPQLKEQIAELEARLSAAPPPKVVSLHPTAVAAYQATMRHLADILRTADPAEDRRLIDSFRALIDRVIVHDGEDGKYVIEIVGVLAPLVGADADVLGGKVVAEEGFEPPTHGL